MRRMSLVLGLLALAFANVAQAGMLVDHVTNPVNWNGVGVFETKEDSLLDFSSAAAFIGNGEKVSKVGIIYAVADGSGNPNAVSAIPTDWYVTFHQDFASYQANPFSVDDNLQETKLFDTPSNPDYFTVIGSTGPYNLMYAEFDVESEGWLTTSGALQAVTILPEPGQHPIIPGFRAYFSFSTGADAIGTETDWYSLDWQTPPFNIPANSFTSVGFPYAKAAYFVSTVR